MSVPANSQLPLSVSNDLESLVISPSGLVPLGAELVFTQDVTGRYLTFLAE